MRMHVGGHAHAGPCGVDSPRRAGPQKVPFPAKPSSHWQRGLPVRRSVTHRACWLHERSSQVSSAGGRTEIGGRLSYRNNIVNHQSSIVANYHPFRGGSVEWLMNSSFSTTVPLHRPFAKKECRMSLLYYYRICVNRCQLLRFTHQSYR